LFQKPHQISALTFFSLIGRFFSGYIHGWLSEQFSGAFDAAFGVTGGYRKAGTSLLKRITRRIFTISK
jgi:hypothetical protein